MPMSSSDTTEEARSCASERLTMTTVSEAKQ
jgi:hypothetical protein